MYIIARDGKLNLVDLWLEIPDTVAEIKTCIDAQCQYDKPLKFRPARYPKPGRSL
ncbi:MAG: hypothetical protein ABFS56_12795 [Pseudomonadota bacterium]